MISYSFHIHILIIFHCIETSHLVAMFCHIYTYTIQICQLATSNFADMYFCTIYSLFHYRFKLPWLTLFCFFLDEVGLFCLIFVNMPLWYLDFSLHKYVVLIVKIWYNKVGQHACIQCSLFLNLYMHISTCACIIIT